MFDGMPNTRWWAFENGRINYNFIKPGTQELSKLIFLEFGLVYANDWYMVPFDLPVGQLPKYAAWLYPMYLEKISGLKHRVVDRMKIGIDGICFQLTSKAIKM